MNPQSAPFLAAFLCGVAAWGAVCARYLTPRLKHRGLAAGVEGFLYLHCFRFIGLAFIAPGVVGAGLAPEWAWPAAVGDMAAALCAALTLMLQRSSWFRAALWLFSVVGIVDLVFAAATGPRYNVPAFLHSAFFIPIFGVPLLMWTHVIVLKALLHHGNQIPVR